MPYKSRNSLSNITIYDMHNLKLIGELSALVKTAFGTAGTRSRLAKDTATVGSGLGLGRGKAQRRSPLFLWRKETWTDGDRGRP